MFQTKQLIIVGGPSAVGKSTLIHNMQCGNNPLLCDQLSVVCPSSFLYLDAWELCKIKRSFVDRLILHYDFIHQYSPKDGFLYLTDLISRSCNVCALTLCAPSDILFQRISSRLKRVQKSNPENKVQIDRLRRKKDMYKDSSKILKIYKTWSTFLNECGVTNFLYKESTCTNSQPCLYDQNEIKKILINKVRLCEDEPLPNHFSLLRFNIKCVTDILSSY